MERNEKKIVKESYENNKEGLKKNVLVARNGP